jgi:hypothetical protein
VVTAGQSTEPQVSLLAADEARQVEVGVFRDGA